MSMKQPKTSSFLRFDWPYHFVTLPLALVLLVCSILLLIRTARVDGDNGLALLVTGFALALVFALMRMRRYATKTQDRIVRIEEQFRHYRLTGKPLHERLTIQQIIALRNAGDDEFPSLCQRAVTERLEPSAIREQISNWREDTMRI
ncbi:DUF6526 family protein [Paenibacillus daejeonensis]|uniref:DUF6526 family protein n=1 Tax=Paenibacillus daejeonensis TaxID=135193 RepID=UPI000364DA66|nr:DUF6526 family protein [Paenibacillus daejeonensis]